MNTMLLEEDLTKISNIVSENLTSNEKLINDVTKYIFDLRGKRIRSSLIVIMANIIGYKDSKYLKIASAVEFIHTATLMHDDVVDNSDKRRFKDAAHIIWGNKLSILSGDFLFSRAFKLMLEIDSIEVLRILSYVFEEIINGEVFQLSVLKQKRMLTLDEYHKIIKSKTSSLFIASCESVAVTCDDSYRDLYRSIGEIFGNTFQIVDDALDYFCSSDRGKNLYDDFREAKVTMPLILLCEKLSEDELSQVHEIFFNRNELERMQSINFVVDLMKKYEVKELIKDYLNNLRRSFFLNVDLLPDSKYRDVLVHLFDSLQRYIN